MNFFKKNLDINCRQILDNMPSGIYFTDRQRKIIYWNKAAENISGYPGIEVIGSHCFDNILIHIDNQGNNLCKGICPLAKTMNDGLTREADVFLHHKDGYRKAVRVYTLPLKDENGDISGGAEFFTDTSEFTAIYEKIRELEKIAFIDKLTNLPNRDHMESELDIKFHELKRYGQRFGLLFLDIDHFKRFNDTHGHDTGDRILKTVADTLRSSSRPFDIFGRWAGDEFIGILKNVDKHDIIMVGNRYRKLIEKSSITINGKPEGITVSIGATIASPDDTSASIVNRADRLMYQCKQEGRNCLATDEI